VPRPFNAPTAWGFVQVLSLWLAGNGIAGLLSGGLRSVDVSANAGEAESVAENAADAVSWGGWALALGMALTLIAAIIGWWIGSRSLLATLRRKIFRCVGGRANPKSGRLGRPGRPTFLEIPQARLGKARKDPRGWHVLRRDLAAAVRGGVSTNRRFKRPRESRR